MSDTRAFALGLLVGALGLRLFQAAVDTLEAQRSFDAFVADRMAQRPHVARVPGPRVLRRY